MKTKNLILSLVLPMVFTIATFAQQTVYAGYAYVQVEYLHGEQQGVRGYIYAYAEAKDAIRSESNLRSYLLSDLESTAQRGMKFVSQVNYVTEDLRWSGYSNTSRPKPTSFYNGAASVEVWKTDYRDSEFKNVNIRCEYYSRVEAAISTFNAYAGPLKSRYPINYPWFKTPINFDIVSCPAN